MTQTISALFDTYEEARSAVDALERSGIAHSDINVVANNADKRWSETDTGVTEADAVSNATGTGLTAGTVLGGGAGLLAGLGMLAIPGVGPVVAAGWLVATLTGAGAGAAAGGLLGALAGEGVSHDDASTYAEGVRRGGTLVSARVPDGQADSARAILNQGSVDPAARRSQYQSAGWTGFDPNAPAYEGGLMGGAIGGAAPTLGAAMADSGMAGRIAAHMDVISSDGATIGKVDHLDGADTIKLAKNASPDGQHHYVPVAWVQRVDTHVHLSKTSAEVKGAW